MYKRSVLLFYVKIKGEEIYRNIFPICIPKLATIETLVDRSNATLILTAPCCL